MRILKRGNRRKYTPIRFLAYHIAWFTFTDDTTSVNERVLNHPFAEMCLRIASKLSRLK